jgi:hypothetical protein
MSALFPDFFFLQSELSALIFGAYILWRIRPKTIRPTKKHKPNKPLYSVGMKIWQRNCILYIIKNVLLHSLRYCWKKHTSNKVEDGTRVPNDGRRQRIPGHGHLDGGIYLTLSNVWQKSIIFAKQKTNKYFLWY